MAQQQDGSKVSWAWCRPVQLSGCTAAHHAACAAAATANDALSCCVPSAPSLLPFPPGLQHPSPWTTAAAAQVCDCPIPAGAIPFAFVVWGQSGVADGRQSMATNIHHHLARNCFAPTSHAQGAPDFRSGAWQAALERPEGRRKER